MENEAIRNRYTPRQYFLKLTSEGTPADQASALVNAIFGGEK